MGDLVMTSYRTRSDQTDEADPRASLIVDPPAQVEAQTQLSNQRTNGHFCQNGGSFKQKNGLKKKLPLNFIRTKTKCRILTAVILTAVILAIVTIILIVCLKSTDDKQQPELVTSVFIKQQESHWMTEYKTTTSSSTFQTTTTTSPKIPEILDYKTYSHPWDSRIFHIEDKKGQIIRTYGKQSQSGRIVSLEHISVSDGRGTDTHIRLGSRNNMASVMLPDGAHVLYDMSEDLRKVELRIFQGPDKESDSNQPSAYVQSVKIDSGVSVLTKLLYTLSHSDDMSIAPQINKTCPPYLPLRVTKCGSQYPYEGAFIEGKVQIGGENSVLMTALPWPTTTDDCFPPSETSNSKPNYYIPLPVKPTKTPGFCPSFVTLVHSVCSNPDVYDPILANETCKNLASKTGLSMKSNPAIYSSIFKSCKFIFDTVDTLCSNLQYKAGIVMPSWMVSKDELNNLCTSNIEELESQTRAPEQVNINLHVLAFCPSIPPFRSPEQTINIKYNQSKSVGSPIHINCDGSPEVTYMSIGHAYTGSENLDQIMHRFKVCSICAFESSVRAVLKEDEICCNNTCLDDRVCNSGRVPAIEESTFKRHSSVYCHDFLAERGYSTNPLHRNCAGMCSTKFSLDFLMFDLSTKKTFYHQKVSCVSRNDNSCQMEFGR